MQYKTIGFFAKNGEKIMLYQSTRNNGEKISSANAILRGIATDGGLYMPESLSDVEFDYKRTLDMDTYEIAEYVLSTLFTDFSKEEMTELVNKAYKTKFETDVLTPTVKVGNSFVLELFRGPTSAFKDVALSMLPQLMTASREKLNISEQTVILTATSGDTGKAALEGFHDVEGTKIIVFYPHGGVSPIQKAQMVTQTGNNVCVCAVRGNFDDAQTGVKKIFNTCSKEGLLKGSGFELSSANSINVGRLAPQIVYYFRSYADLVRNGEIKAGDKVNFVVPTGNFGDILAGYFAKLLGLPVDKLVCASNANDVLTEFLNTGRYNRMRTFYKTVSPSMDILVSSNLERLLYLALDCDAEKTAAYMKSLDETGEYTVESETLVKLKDIFFAGCCDDEQTEKTIGEVYEKFGYLCDTHTAVAWNVAEQFKKETGNKNPVIVLSTASPYKFADAVSHAIGLEPQDDEFVLMDNLCEKTGVAIPKGLAGLKGKEELHKDVIDKDKMLEYVLGKLGESEWTK